MAKDQEHFKHYLNVCKVMSIEENMFVEAHLSEITKRYMLTKQDFRKMSGQVCRIPENRQKILDIRQEVEEGNYSLDGEKKEVIPDHLKVFGKSTGKFMDKNLALKMHMKLH